MYVSDTVNPETIIGVLTQGRKKIMPVKKQKYL